METDAQLEQKLGEVDDVAAETRSYVWHEHALLFGFVTLVSILCCAGLLYLFVPIYQSETRSDTRILLLPFLPLLAPVLLYITYRGRVRRIFCEEIAAQLGYTYAPAASMNTVNASFFRIGHGQSISNVFGGMHNGLPIRIFDYRYTVGYGRNSRMYACTVFETSHSGSLPHLAMNFPSVYAIDAPSGMEKVELEGEFNKTFSLYVEAGEQIEAREIFQPDVMQEFMDSLAAFTMEVFENHIYLMRKGQLNDRRTFLDLIAAIDKVFDALQPGLRSAGEAPPETAPAFPARQDRVSSNAAL